MKNLIILLFIGSLLSCTQLSTNERNNEESAPLFRISKTDVNKGRHVTSNGKLRTLIVYVSFSDDTTTKSKSWEMTGNVLPNWTKQMLNPTENLYFPHNNLSQYFHEMSFGNLLLYGDIYPKVVIPKHNQNHYKNIGEVNSEVLISIDGEVDFSKYDNWSKGENNKFVSVPDGIVDLIFVVYRNFENKLYFNNGWTGIAHLHLSDDIKTNDGVKITKGRLDNGSGISSRGGKNGFSFMKYILAHEFGHFLFGAGHIENTTHLALMTGGPVWNASRGMNSWEKEKLGWIEYKDISTELNSTLQVNDYHTSGEAYRLKLSDKEWYVFENHQGISKNDLAKDKGIYIYHIKNANRFSPSITVKCADGDWDFSVDKKNQKLIRSTPNSSGKSELNFRKVIDKKSYACYNQVYEDNSAWGDKYDAFDRSYNNVFSPVSNPSSKNGKKISFSIEVKKEERNHLFVDFNFYNIYQNTAPSKPQILNISKNSSSTLLNWIANQEPDLSSYKIYYSLSSNKKLVLYKSVKKNIKPSLNISTLIYDKKAKVNIAITAIDNDGLESVKSNFLEINYNADRNKWESRIKEEI